MGPVISLPRPRSRALSWRLRPSVPRAVSSSSAARSRSGAVLGAEVAPAERFDIVPTTEVIEMGATTRQGFPGQGRFVDCRRVRLPRQRARPRFRQRRFHRGHDGRFHVRRQAHRGSSGLRFRPSCLRLPESGLVVGRGLHVIASPRCFASTASSGRFSPSRSSVSRRRASPSSISGEEETKGNAQVKAATSLLRDEVAPSISSVTSRVAHLLRQGADVIVCDGFVGNTSSRWPRALPYQQGARRRQRVLGRK